MFQRCVYLCGKAKNVLRTTITQYIKERKSMLQKTVGIVLHTLKIQ